jgi:cell division protein FtsQ
MKRPPNLDRPSAPEPAAERAAASATAKPRRTGRATPAPAGVRAEATTEPITLPTLPSAPTEALAPVVSLQRPAEKPAEAADSRVGTSAHPDSLTPAAARKQLRAATKARKHYERGEVRRFTWRSRRRRRTWLVVAAAAVALAAFVVVGAYSPLMALRTIDVVGTNRIPAEQVQAALSTQIGTPLPIVDGNQIKRELSTFTLIQSYSIESRPPNTLVVRIVEREPVGLLGIPTGFELVDAAGVPLQSGAERVPGYPVITAANGVGHPGFTAAAAVIRALPESIRTQLDSVTAATTDDVTLTLNGGARIVWGSAERSDYKAVVLASLMVSYPPGSVGEYDVTSPDSAVLR